ncbi:MAG: hypothetical protein JXR04_06120 [Bermanella sp.]
MLYLTKKSQAKRDLMVAASIKVQECNDYIESKFLDNEFIKSLKKLRATIANLEVAYKRALKTEKKHQKRWPCRKWYEDNIVQFKATSPDIDTKLKQAKQVLKYWEALEKDLSDQCEKVKASAINRINKSESLSRELINKNFSRLTDSQKEAIKSDDILMHTFYASIFTSALGSGVSHLSLSGVYDALREVNGNFESLSGIEIWFESLAMSDASLQGLINLTKGRYFENLVAEDTGGVLFENFNHPDTDMMLDGVGFQLKATDSANYINSIDDDIAVIATSEVAGVTGVVDSGISNEEITDDVSTALGGSLLDGSDIFAIFSGTLSIFVILSANADYQERREQGESIESAIFSTTENIAIKLYRSFLRLLGLLVSLLDVIWILIPWKLIKKVF